MAPTGPITTPLTQVLGIQHPIMLAGMAHVANAPLAAAVSNAGGIGVVGGIMYSPAQLREIIAELKSLLKHPDLPWGLDLALPKVGGGARKTNHDYTNGKLDQLIDLAIEFKTHLFVSAVGTPPKWVIDKLHKHNILVMNMVGHPKHAKKALDMGIDMVCAQGSEGGGHTGNVATSILVPAVVDIAKNYKPPMLNGHSAIVVAAGGISNGRGLAASLMQGAAGVWVGTRFVASVEGGTSDQHKEAVVTCDYDQTEKTLVISGRPLRLKVNEYIQKWHDQPERIKELCDKGIVPLEHDLDTGEDFDFPHIMGQIAGSITKVQPAAEIVDEMVQEATQQLKLASTVLSPASKL